MMRNDKTLNLALNRIEAISNGIGVSRKHINSLVDEKL